MRLKYGQCQPSQEGFTFRSLFSRRPKRDRKPKHSPTPYDEPVDPISTFRTRGRANAPLKELEILGLATDPRGQAPPSRSWHSRAGSDNRFDGPAEPVNIPFLYPFASAEVHGSQYEYKRGSQRQSQEQTREKSVASHPPSPLLPPPPSLSLSPPQHAQEPDGRTSEEDIGAPLTPTLSYKTYASSGIFPWGSEPHVADDDVSEILVLPSPPRLMRSYAYRG
ncbi:hypothetical protein BDV18DRAFT_132041 [Aspergillus unguis]